MSVVLVTLWAFFQEALEVVVTRAHIASVIEATARAISSVSGVAVPYSRAVTLAAIGVLTVLAFAWGYVFHVSRFGHE